MNCLAIDDEPLALDVIEDFSQRIPFISLIGKCTSAFEAIEIMNQSKIDLIFLDINMPYISGIEFMKSIESRPMVIFTTAYSEFALEGFELSAVDYLVKPIAYERFLKAVNKAFELYSLKQSRDEPSESLTRPEAEYLMVKADYSTVKINLNDIAYIEGLKDYIKIYLGGRPLLTKSTMKNIEAKLPAHKFVRVHKSYIVAIAKIEAIENQRIIIGDKRIPVGEQYKDGFNIILDNLRL